MVGEKHADTLNVQPLTSGGPLYCLTILHYLLTSPHTLHSFFHLANVDWAPVYARWLFLIFFSLHTFPTYPFLPPLSDDDLVFYFREQRSNQKRTSSPPRLTAPVPVAPICDLTVHDLAVFLSETSPSIRALDPSPSCVRRTLCPFPCTASVFPFLLDYSFQHTDVL